MRRRAVLGMALGLGGFGLAGISGLGRWSLGPPGARAGPNPDEILDDAALEQRARALSKNLRCLVCQNQSIDDSDAALARDLRILVRERLVAGDSDAEVIAFLTARYGDFVLLKPPMKPATWGLWFGPAAVLLLAVAGVAVYLRRRSTAPDAPPPLDPAERARLDAIVGGGQFTRDATRQSSQ